MNRGWTLPEVCVAFAVFLVGTTALLGCWNFFNREVASERLLVARFYDVLSAMETLIADRPSCADSLLTERFSDSSAVAVRLTRVPGSPHLAWAIAAKEGVSLKRLIRCK